MHIPCSQNEVCFFIPLRVHMGLYSHLPHCSGEKELSGIQSHQTSWMAIRPSTGVESVIYRGWSMVPDVDHSNCCCKQESPNCHTLAPAHCWDHDDHHEMRTACVFFSVVQRAESPIFNYYISILNTSNCKQKNGVVLSNIRVIWCFMSWGHQSFCSPTDSTSPLWFVTTWGPGQQRQQHEYQPREGRQNPQMSWKHCGA